MKTGCQLTENLQKKSCFIQGIDIIATYNLDLESWGALRLSAAANLNDTEVSHVKDNPPELNSLGDNYQLFARSEVGRFEEGTPDNKLNLSATWDYQQWQTILRLTRYGEVADIGSDPESDEYIDAKWITDLETAYRPNDDWKIALGANNLFDQYPQATVNNIGFTRLNQVLPYTAFTPYSLDGRFLYGNITYNF